MAGQSAGRNIGNLRPVNDVDGNAIAYAAGRVERPLYVIFSSDLRTLTCQGIMIDCVDGMRGLKLFQRDEGENGEERDNVYEWTDSTSRVNIPKAPTAAGTSFFQKAQNVMTPGHACTLIESITLCLLLNHTVRYLSYEAPAGYMRGDFLALYLAAVETPMEVHHLFLDWFQRNRPLHIQGYSIGESCKAAVALKELQHRPTDQLVLIASNPTIQQCFYCPRCRPHHHSIEPQKHPSATQMKK